jgi:hypothetical protein
MNLKDWPLSDQKQIRSWVSKTERMGHINKSRQEACFRQTRLHILEPDTCIVCKIMTKQITVMTI